MSNKIISDFLRLRREIRKTHAVLDQAFKSMRQLEREVKALDTGTPFDQARAATYRSRLDAMESLREVVLQRRRQLGQDLLAMAPAFDAATTFEQRLELLNVNVADRAQIDAGAGLVMIMAGHCLEDSAARRREHYCSGPMFEAVQLEIVIWMSRSDEGRAATDKAMVDTFGAPAYRLFGQKPDLQLVTANTTQTIPESK